MLVPAFREMQNLVSIDRRNALITELEILAENIEVNILQTQEAASQSSGEFDPFLAEFIDTPVAMQSSQLTASHEVKAYIEDALPSSTEVLEFWSKHKSVYPRLYKIAQRLHSTPASSLLSERNFNFASITYNKRRSSLNPNKVDKLLFIRSNFDLI